MNKVEIEEEKWSYESLVSPENRIKSDYTNMDEME
jgi:hypothetical protein